MQPFRPLESCFSRTIRMILLDIRWNILEIKWKILCLMPLSGQNLFVRYYGTIENRLFCYHRLPISWFWVQKPLPKLVKLFLEWVLLIIAFLNLLLSPVLPILPFYHSPCFQLLKGFIYGVNSLISVIFFILDICPCSYLDFEFQEIQRRGIFPSLNARCSLLFRHYTWMDNKND